MEQYDRREFLQVGGIFLAQSAMHPLFRFRDLDPLLNSRRDVDLLGTQARTPEAIGLCNANLQTAIGLGDKTPGIIDDFGQLDSRNATITWDIVTEASNSSRIRLSQTLADGYLPSVMTEVETAKGIIHCLAYALSAGYECFEIEGALQSLRVRIWFPYARSVQVKDGIVTADERILAIIPADWAFEITEAKYNLLTPVRDTCAGNGPQWGSPIRRVSGCQIMNVNVDSAFNNGRFSFFSRPLKYVLPAQSRQTYHVVMGIIIPAYQCEIPDVGISFFHKAIVRLWVNDSYITVDAACLVPGQPFLHKFVTQAPDDRIIVRSEVDPSSPDPNRITFLNAIWVFEKDVDLEDVESGSLNRDALFYIPCGEEPEHDVAASLTVSFANIELLKDPARIYLPYNLDAKNPTGYESFGAGAALLDVKQRWESILSRGAEFITGDEQLDNLYKTSLINIFLLRTKYPGIASNREDIYVVKPGATNYNAFWYRDGAYIITSLDVAGLLDEAERSLRLFWQPGLPANLVSLGQQQNGAWQAPIDEFDGQGQALWALCHHFRISGDKQWLRQVYPNIRKGALWIKEVTEESKFVAENGERPIYYGLLPAAHGEDIGNGINYYHNFWAIFGLRMAIDVASIVDEKYDIEWMSETYATYKKDLLASVKSAFELVGQSRYIPATPYDPISKAEIWGSIAALYPTRFLEPNDPMMSMTLGVIENGCKEDEYTYFNRRKLWTYITPDWAMCYLLRGELGMFHRLFDGYVAHASPTNAWAEEIFLDSRIGTGDMPHGWAAAQYIHLHRNALVFEDDGILHLCWGAKQAWLENGIRVKNAPTQYGFINMELKMLDGSISLNYRFLPRPGGPIAREIRLHVPPMQVSAFSIRVNGNSCLLVPNEHYVRLD